MHAYDCAKLLLATVTSGDPGFAQLPAQSPRWVILVVFW
jgi:hypothetical protein